ncbi:endolytic transglycosylase MltG [Sporolactobacillus sp. CQH2019]|uniref:endolytic transglycosylase MltG n=1 Tax=Sporolactobacillus sp. CQH2019 TaxID=3023512 RepID=UPI002367D598|nr:endolytic transglycosylase MltG [Sporolactobacillus sp. CQH2019]MDD9147636.1 endolytic transglycosylase MltG [Sporolactobacillus sp. CQH2019]
MKLRTSRRRLFAMIVGGAVILLIIFAWGLSDYYAGLLKPVNPKNNQAVTVTIPAGSSLKEVGQTLEKNGLIRKAWAFEFYARWKHLNQYRSGTYTFNRTMSVDRLINDLGKGNYNRLVFIVDVRQGMWLSETAGQMSKASGLSTQDILNKLKDPSYIKAHYMKRYPFLTDRIFTKGVYYPLEGYLAPGVYQFVRGKNPPTLDQMVDRMLDKTGQTVTRFSKEIKTNSLGSLHSILTMASLVEQEAPDAKDRQKIAGVFYNRLAKKMKLQTDPSVAYGQQKRIGQYTMNELTTDTPYNTYTRAGLIVGPIGSPAPDAVQAVLEPIRSNDYYFYARPNGQIFYSKTYAEHQAIVAKYSHEWAKKS